MLVFRSTEDHVVEPDSCALLLRQGSASTDVREVRARGQLPRRDARQRRADDLRGQPGVRPPTRAAPTWRRREPTSRPDATTACTRRRTARLRRPRDRTSSTGCWTGCATSSVAAYVAPTPGERGPYGDTVLPGAARATASTVDSRRRDEAREVADALPRRGRRRAGLGRHRRRRSTRRPTADDGAPLAGQRGRRPPSRRTPAGHAPAAARPRPRRRPASRSCATSPAAGAAGRRRATTADEPLRAAAAAAAAACPTPSTGSPGRASLGGPLFLLVAALLGVSTSSGWPGFLALAAVHGRLRHARGPDEGPSPDGHRAATTARSSRRVRQRRSTDPCISETVEVRGHLMDSGVLARVLDDVLEYGGDYSIDRFDVGHDHDDESYARLTVKPRTSDALARLRHAAADPRRQPGRPRRGGAARGRAATASSPTTSTRRPTSRPSCASAATGCRSRTRRWTAARRRRRPGAHRRRSATCGRGDTVVCGAGGVKVVPLPAIDRSARRASSS